MKLSHIRPVGRFHNATTGQTVNIKKGNRVGRGTDVYFYLHRHTRIVVTDEIYGSRSMWKRIDAPQPPCCGGNDEALEHAHTLDCDKHPGEPIPVPARTPPTKSAEPVCACGQPLVRGTFSYVEGECADCYAAAYAGVRK